MHTIKVTWNGLHGHWLANELIDDQLQTSEPLEQWAARQSDLTSVRVLLSALNYSCHWVAMPGISGRHIQKALPFALEEQLIDDPANYLIVAAGKQGSQVRAYAVSLGLIEQLLSFCDLHHLLVRELIPETALLAAEALIIDAGDSWLLTIPGRFEGQISQMAVGTLLDSCLEEWQSTTALTIRSHRLDQAQLLKTTIETGFPQAFTAIHAEPHSGLGAAYSLVGKLPSLLVGHFQARDQREHKPAAWWRPLGWLSAAAMLLLAVSMGIQNHQLQTHIRDINGQSIALYKQLFPGERIRNLERDFRSKLEGGNNTSSSGFVSLMNRLAKGYASAGIKSAQISSVRFSDRQQELIVEIQVQNLNDLQNLRQALEKQGLLAEVSSASNEKEGVKGRLKIGEPV